MHNYMYYYYCTAASRRFRFQSLRASTLFEQQQLMHDISSCSQSRMVACEGLAFAVPLNLQSKWKSITVTKGLWTNRPQAM